MSTSDGGPETLATLLIPEGPPAPFTVGVGLSRGVLRDAGAVALHTASGPVPLQATASSRWADGSVRWLLCDFVAGGGQARIVRGSPSTGPWAAPALVGRLTLVDHAGRSHAAVVESTSVEAAGPVRATTRGEGRLGPLRLFTRTTRWAGRSETRIEVTLRNPRAAKHAGGCWDLGDPGSVRLRDVSLGLDLAGDAEWRPTPDAPWRPAPAGFQLFQASSGGPNWRCANHVNRDGAVPLAFRGWRASDGTSGLRASPGLRVGGTHVAVPGFWEEFPRVLALEGGAVRVGLWPREHGDPHELQGGEQKTFTVWIAESPLDEVYAPRRPVQPPAELAATEAAGHLGLPAHDDPAIAARLAIMVDADRGFAARREQIDEYGWRNFGDLYADHEAVQHESVSDQPFVSHYNNQYDCVEAFLLMYLRSADPRWWALAEPLARHVIDVDLYHTQEDRSCYNGGLFWHTDHYRPAGTATHRCYSRENGGSGYGGGHSDEHDYPSGLLLYHHLTGDPRAAEAVLQLAGWVRDMDDGTKTVFGLIDAGPTGLATATYTPDYHGPGRGAGNSVNACCEAFALTGDRAWLDLAAALVERVVHPGQDLDALDLLDAERRWSYVVFLKYLLKYVALKDELGERDAHYAYARDALVRYATWMVAHERPSTSRPDQLEHVTETWPAQDLRKAQVVEGASAYVDEATRRRWRGWARETFDRALAELSAHCTADRCRPLVLTIHPAIHRAWATAHPSHAISPHDHTFDFGSHARFVPQKDRVKALLKTPGGLIRAIGLLLRPATWKRLRLPW